MASTSGGENIRSDRYVIGLLDQPWFEGKMTGCLVDILRCAGQFGDMLILVLSYVAVIVIVQSSRYIKRFYVRRFAKDVNRRMKEILYGSLVRKSRASLKEEGEGNKITKAILDVDDCVEGMRKFTTEIFDTAWHWQSMPECFCGMTGGWRSYVCCFRQSLT